MILDHPSQNLKIICFSCNAAVAKGIVLSSQHLVLVVRMG